MAYFAPVVKEVACAKKRVRSAKPMISGQPLVFPSVLSINPSKSAASASQSNPMRVSAAKKRLKDDLIALEQFKPNITVYKSWPKRTPHVRLISCTNLRSSPSNATESNGLDRLDHLYALQCLVSVTMAFRPLRNVST